MALLELVKLDKIVFRQLKNFGPIWIYRKRDNPDFAKEMIHDQRSG